MQKRQKYVWRERGGRASNINSASSFRTKPQSSNGQGLWDSKRHSGINKKDQEHYQQETRLTHDSWPKDQWDRSKYVVVECKPKGPCAHKKSSKMCTPHHPYHPIISILKVTWDTNSLLSSVFYALRKFHFVTSECLVFWHAVWPPPHSCRRNVQWVAGNKNLCSTEFSCQSTYWQWRNCRN